MKVLFGKFNPVLIFVVLSVAFLSSSILNAADNDAVVFISIGQSNGDGSAFADSILDAEMREWYGDSLRERELKIWYRSCRVENQDSNVLGERARWCVDGDVIDMVPQWMDLWYKDDNLNGRTSMQMIHGFGTYSQEAADRRGTEGMFGKKFAETFPDKELYVLKLGVSGSQISTWAHPGDETNWKYFYENIFKPSMTDLLDRGKRPVLAGIFWMQGCADKSSEKDYYSDMLKRLIFNLRTQTGFEGGRIYVGRILGPGENDNYPAGSVAFSPIVRQSQDEVAASDDNVVILDTKDCEMQYEKAFNGYIHFSHAGVNRIGEKLVVSISKDREHWVPFSTPGSWETVDGEAVFVPSVGNPSISYSRKGDVITATLDYGGWRETKSHVLR